MYGRVCVCDALQGRLGLLQQREGTPFEIKAWEEEAEMEYVRFF